MIIQELVEFLKPYKYVVQRNFHQLPELDKEHPDLDLFVCEEQANELKLALKELDWVDVRCPSDNYYPDSIANLLLSDRKEHKSGFMVPNATAYFFSLYYHNITHKKDNPYQKELNNVFRYLFPPVKCSDEGVGYYDSD